jgi:hypothetical protein
MSDLQVASRRFRAPFGDAAATFTALRAGSRLELS